MGTRSTIHFIRKRGEKLEPMVTIYQQFDGYIDGVGHELADFLLSKKIINGISSGQDNFHYANGFGCLIAQYIREHKDSVGNLYITNLDDSQEYNYYVEFDEDKYFSKDIFDDKPFEVDELITIEVDSTPAFRGKPSELLEFEENFDE